MAILLLNLALLFWGSSRPASQGPALRGGDRSSAAELPRLVLVDEAKERPVGSQSVAGRCLRMGPLDPEDAIAMEESLASWNLTWQRREGAEGWVLDVEPGSSSVWPESDIRALADAVAAEISPCRTPDPIAPERPRP